MKRPQEWLAEAQVWRKKAEIVRKEISAIEAVPGQWFGPTDVEEQMTNIVAISPGGHVVASQKSDDGRRDAAFLKRYLNKKYAVQLLPEQEAHRRYMRYVASLRNFSTKSEEAES
jgi:hypothetical protein